MLASVGFPLFYLADVLLDDIAFVSGPLLLVLPHHSYQSTWITFLVFILRLNRPLLHRTIVFSVAKLDSHYHLDSLRTLKRHKHHTRQKVRVHVRRPLKRLACRLGALRIVFQLDAEALGVVQFAETGLFGGGLVPFKRPVNIEITTSDVLDIKAARRSLLMNRNFADNWHIFQAFDLSAA